MLPDSCNAELKVHCRAQHLSVVGVNFMRQCSTPWYLEVMNMTENSFCYILSSKTAKCALPAAMPPPCHCALLCITRLRSNSHDEDTTMALQILSPPVTFWTRSNFIA